jgi:hypothetical protein
LTHPFTAERKNYILEIVKDQTQDKGYVGRENWVLRKSMNEISFPQEIMQDYDVRDIAIKQYDIKEFPDKVYTSRGLFRIGMTLDEISKKFTPYWKYSYDKKKNEIKVDYIRIYFPESLDIIHIADLVLYFSEDKTLKKIKIALKDKEE